MSVPYQPKWILQGKLNKDTAFLFNTRARGNVKSWPLVHLSGLFTCSSEWILKLHNKAVTDHERASDRNSSPPQCLRALPLQLFEHSCFNPQSPTQIWFCIISCTCSSNTEYQNLKMMNSDHWNLKGFLLPAHNPASILSKTQSRYQQVIWMTKEIYVKWIDAVTVIWLSGANGMNEGIRTPHCRFRIPRKQTSSLNPFLFSFFLPPRRRAMTWARARPGDCSSPPFQQPPD